MINLYDPYEQIDFYLRRGEAATNYIEKDQYTRSAHVFLSRGDEEPGSRRWHVPGGREEALRVRLAALQESNAMLRAKMAEQILADEELEDAPLRSQCAALGIPLLEIRLKREGKEWIVDGSGYRRPEDAVRAKYQLDGWNGTTCEGFGPLTLIRCACLKVLKRDLRNHKHLTFDAKMAREIACRVHFARLCDPYDGVFGELLQCIESITDKEMLANFKQVFRNTTSSEWKFTVEELCALWSAMGAQGVYALAKAFLDRGAFYDRGLPDLTLARGNAVKFIEVKTTDRLHFSQLHAFRNFLIPYGADLSVVKLKADPHAER